MYRVSPRLFGVLVSSAVTYTLVRAVSVSAQACTSGAFCNPLKYNSIEQLLLAILDAVILIMFPVVALSLVYSGFLFVKAQGEPAKLEEARRALLWGLVGGGVLLGAKAFALAIEATVTSLLP